MNVRRRRKERLLISLEEANDLYLDRGMSINVIAKERGVHPDLLRRDLLYLGVKLRPYRQKPNDFHYDASGHETLEALALGIWLGEGTKAGRQVEVTNCDPLILKIWVAFLRQVCHADTTKIKLVVILHDPGLSEQATDYWRTQLGDFPCQLRYKVGAGGSHKIPMGTARVVFNSKFLIQRIQQRAVELASALK